MFNLEFSNLNLAQVVNYFCVFIIRELVPKEEKFKNNPDNYGVLTYGYSTIEGFGRY